MNLRITGTNVDVTDAIKDYIRKKLKKVTKYLRDIIEIHVTVKQERYQQICEITILAGHITVRGEGDTADLYASVDLAVERIEKQIRRYRGKLISRRHRGADSVQEAKMSVLEHSSVILDGKPVVIVEDMVPVKPMSVEEAVMQMDLMNRDFLVFKNAESDAVNVIYNRTDGNIGLIET
ncbi:MAG: ribosome-associated translation inhibitor RaiA [Candidatus Coatesbacteria bacterium]|nr:MAG: ribosome-associated translation inhibitor RaiA [Candidatus Coatesbacteria bacterium]